MPCILPPLQAPYSNCIFLHEGWPLCLHEKVVVHLAPLNPLLLRAGDFYLQAEPCQEHAARIALKHLSPDLDSVQETPVPESTYALLFTNEWLEEINCNYAGPPLHTCLVATENGVTPLPWSKIATPEFVDKPKAEPSGTLMGAPGGPGPEPVALTEPMASITPTPHGTAESSVPYRNIAGIAPGCRDSWKPNQGRYPGLIKVEQAGMRQNPTTLAVPSLQEIISQNLGGEYVELLQLSQQDLGLLATSRSAAAQPWVGSWPCRGALSSQDGPCTPCQRRRRLSGEPGPHGPRCRHRDSYLAALQNPVSFGPALMAAILEEPDSSAPLAEPPVQGGSGASTPCPRRARARGSGGQAVGQHSPHLPTAPTRSEAVGSGHKFSFLKGPRLGESAGSQHESGWRKVSAIYSPRMGRAKPAGKGDDRAGLRGAAFLRSIALCQPLSSVPTGRCRCGSCSPCRRTVPAEHHQPERPLRALAGAARWAAALRHRLPARYRGMLPSAGKRSGGRSQRFAPKKAPTSEISLQLGKKKGQAVLSERLTRLPAARSPPTPFLTNEAFQLQLPNGERLGSSFFPRTEKLWQKHPCFLGGDRPQHLNHGVSRASDHVRALGGWHSPRCPFGGIRHSWIQAALVPDPLLRNASVGCAETPGPGRVGGITVLFQLCRRHRQAGQGSPAGDHQQQRLGGRVVLSCRAGEAAPLPLLPPKVRAGRT